MTRDATPDDEQLDHAWRARAGVRRTSIEHGREFVRGCVGLVRPDPVPILWHYTTTKALLEILESQELHLTCYRFLNDPGEGRVAHSLVQRCWQHALRREKSHAHLDLKALHRTSQHVLAAEQVANREDSGSDQTTFTFSASANSDSLSQWARYADDGMGVALGISIDLEALGHPLSKMDWHFGPFVSRVEYWQDGEKTAARTLESQLQDRLYEFLREASDPQEIDNSLLRISRGLAPSVKAKGFEEEAELRISASTVPHSKDLYRIRTTRHGIAPVMTLPLEGAGVRLTHLVLGPRLGPENLWSVEWMMAKFGLPELEV